MCPAGHISNKNALSPKQVTYQSCYEKRTSKFRIQINFMIMSCKIKGKYKVCMASHKLLVKIMYNISDLCGGWTLPVHNLFHCILQTKNKWVGVQPHAFYCHLPLH